MTGRALRPWQVNIIAALEESSVRVFTLQQLVALINRLAIEIALPESTRAQRVIRFLLETKRLRKQEVTREELTSDGTARRKKSDGDEESAFSRKSFPRYIWDEASPYEMALSLRKGSYLSHASAVFLHGLTQQIPRTIYVNKEQTPKPASAGHLTQAGIDRAFRNTPRTSNYVFLHEDTRIVLLSGKHTGDKEVSEIPGPDEKSFRATKLERTLIDIAVRPAYAGGVFDVLGAFRSAVARDVSIPVLMATLRHLDYVYPFHQVIGFYLQNAGAPEKSLSRLRDLGLHFDFYLTNRMPNPQYDPSWKIYFPSGLVEVPGTPGLPRA